MATVEEMSAADGDLVAAIARGEPAALETLYARLQGPLGSYLALFIRDRALREEVVQDTFFAVWTGARGFRGQSSVRSWLFAIGRRRAIDALRGARIEIDAVDLTEHADTEPGPEEQVIAVATQEAIAAAVARLAPLHREVLVLTFEHGLSYEETARVLGTPVGTVKSRLSNARRALCRHLSAQGADRP